MTVAWFAWRELNKKGTQNELIELTEADEALSAAHGGGASRVLQRQGAAMSQQHRPDVGGAPPQGQASGPAQGQPNAPGEGQPSPPAQGQPTRETQDTKRGGAAWSEPNPESKEAWINVLPGLLVLAAAAGALAVGRLRVRRPFAYERLGAEPAGLVHE